MNIIQLIEVIAGIIGTILGNYGSFLAYKEAVQKIKNDENKSQFKKLSIIFSLFINFCIIFSCLFYSYSTNVIKKIIIGIIQTIFIIIIVLFYVQKYQKLTK